jgi:hypothetical protein
MIHGGRGANSDAILLQELAAYDGPHHCCWQQPIDKEAPTPDEVAGVHVYATIKGLSRRRHCLCSAGQVIQSLEFLHTAQTAAVGSHPPVHQRLLTTSALVAVWGACLGWCQSTERL